MIRELGILDTDLVAHHDAFGVPTRDDQHGVAYPMLFVLDAQGVVERKIVEESYRVRSGGQRLLAELTGVTPPLPADAPSATAAQRGPSASDVLTLRAWVDSPTYYAYQRIGLHLELAIAPGWHLYAPSVPGGYQGLALTVRSEPAGARLGPIAWPAAHPFEVSGLDEELPVYTGTVRLIAPLEVIIARGSGEARIDLEVRSQACTANECLPPATLRASLRLPEAPTL